MTNTKKLIILAVILIAIVVCMKFIVKAANTPGKYDTFAQCLKEKGALFYGAFWCPHCQEQKKAFGSSKKYLPYVECSTADGRAQKQICIDKKIEGYPTWTFADGTTLSGEIALEVLAEKTSCTLPKE